MLIHLRNEFFDPALFCTQMHECTVGKCQEKIGFFDLFVLNAVSFDMFNGFVKCRNALIQA
jgi:hypothetical protein